MFYRNVFFYQEEINYDNKEYYNLLSIYLDLRFVLSILQVIFGMFFIKYGVDVIIVTFILQIIRFVR